ncbi:APC family permease [Tardisphaera saccharovorans]
MEEVKEIELSRSLSFWALLAAGVGDIVGSSIFFYSGYVLHIAGPAAVLAYLLVGLFGLGIALISAEIASMPKVRKTSGAIYSFTKEGLGGFWAMSVGLMRVMGYTIGGAAVAIAMATFVKQAVLIGLFNVVTPPHFVSALAAAVLGAWVLLNVIGVKPTATTEMIFVAFKVSVILLFAAVVVALVTIQPPSNLLAHFSPLAPNGFSGFMKAAVIAFFAYTGFNTVAVFTAEAKRPERDVPRGIYGSQIVAMSIYVGVLVVLLLARGWYRYGKTTTAFIAALSAVNAPILVKLLVIPAALLASAGVTLLWVASSSRTIYQMSKDGFLPKPLSKLNSRRAPWTATLLAAFLMAVAFITPSFIYLASLATFGFIYSYLFVGPSLLSLRKKGYKGKFRAPFYPVLEVVMFALTLLFISSFQLSVLEEGAAALILIAIIYVLYRTKAPAEPALPSEGGENEAPAPGSIEASREGGAGAGKTSTISKKADDEPRQGLSAQSKPMRLRQ